MSDFSNLNKLIPWTQEERSQEQFAFRQHSLQGIIDKIKSNKQRKVKAGKDIHRATVYVGYTPVSVLMDQAGNIYGVITKDGTVSFDDFVDKVAKTAGIGAWEVPDLFKKGQNLSQYNLNPEDVKNQFALVYGEDIPIAQQFDQAYQKVINGTTE